MKTLFSGCGALVLAAFVLACQMPNPVAPSGAVRPALAVSGASDVVAQQPFTKFAYPQDGDTIRRGQTVHVTATRLFGDPPADGRLEFSEDEGLTWAAIPGAQINGRSISGFYVPIGSQASVVKFRTDSIADPGFGAQVAVSVVD